MDLPQRAQLNTENAKSKENTMKTLKRTLILLLALLMLTAVLCGCKDGKSAPVEPTPGVSATEPVRGGELTVGIAQDLDDSLDPHKMTAAGTREILFNVFEGLVKPDENGNLIPAVASSYTIAETGDAFTFTLRDGVRFHNGSEVTVGDIVYSISRVAGLDTGTPLIAAFSAVKSVEATDDRTVVVKTQTPYLEFLSYLTCAVIPENSDPADGLIGTGPFSFSERKAQESIVIERFDDYWGQPAYLDKVTFKIIENANTLVMSLKSGAIDLCAHLTTAQAAELGSDFNIAEGSMNLVQAMYLNNAYGPLQDVRVRQALCCAVDREAILGLINDGRGSILGSSMYPAFGKYYADLSTYYTKDIDRAKQLLSDAGYADGFDLEITAPMNYQIHVDTAQVIAEQLKAIGVNCTINTVEWSTWLEKVYQNRDYQATVVGFDTSAAMTAQSLLARFESTSGKNVCNFSSAQYDERYAAAIASTDEAGQVAAYQDCQQILAENAAAVYVQDPCDLVAMRSDIGGYRFYPIYVMDLSCVSYMK